MSIELTTATTGQISGIKASLFIDKNDNTSDLDKPVSTAQQTYITGISGDLRTSINVLDAATGNYVLDSETGSAATLASGVLLDRATHIGTQTASTISDFDTEVSNNTDVSANTSARHDAVTVTDSTEIDFTLVGQDITASLKDDSIDETKLDASVNNSLDLADSSVQPADIGTIASFNSGDYLNTARTATYTPSADYHPSTKKYVDDHVAVSATTTTKGHVELATNTEAHAATDTTRAVTPSNLLIKKDGTAIVAGDFTGNSRGANALDVQSSRGSATQVASGSRSSAIGYFNTASGNSGASAVGYNNTASGTRSSAVGEVNTASGNYSSAFGYDNTASGYYSSAFGYNNTASGASSSAFGYNNTASGSSSSAVGSSNTASGANSSAVGYSNTASGLLASAVGYNNTASGFYSSAFGYGNEASVGGSSAIGQFNTASAYGSSAFGRGNNASGDYSSAIGYQNTASGELTSAFGYHNTASGNYSSAFGYNNTASGNYSSAIGYENTSSSYRSSACGCGNTTASGYYSSAFGYGNTASGRFTSAFGYNNTSSGNYSSAFGYHNTASGNFSSTLGYNNTSSGNFSSALGYNNTASGPNSSAVGHRVKTTVQNTFEAGYWSNATTRTTAIRMHPNGQVAMTIEDSASAPTDGGATAGSEADGELARGMFAIQKNGTAVTLYYNNAGTIQSLSLGTLS